MTRHTGEDQSPTLGPTTKHQHRPRHPPPRKDPHTTPPPHRPLPWDT
uniref:Uncharacterized protein n=1 Tax=Siphoviridae sp. ctgaU3 TaxID=2825609 RepID=A0A8S5UW74_9CAUD|nr:MAG TPA: hypothetical protein [Siphoviridae sp. ctgaU3]